jgi:hypothetical protein
MNIEQKVIAALANEHIGATELEDLITHVEDGIKEAERNVVKTREAAFDPAISPDLSAARQRLEDASFLLGRLRTQLPRLERRLSQVIAADLHASWLKDYNKVLEKRDAAVELYKKYPECVAILRTILHTAQNVDIEIARVNSTAPSGESRRLVGVELSARQLSAFSRLYPSIADRIILPDLENADRNLWPPPPPPAPIIPPQPQDVRFTADWAVNRDQRLRAEREKAERDRQQFEADAEAGQSDGGRTPVWWKPNGITIE